MLQPLRNYIAVREHALPSTFTIELPDQVKDPVVCGEIMAAGPGMRLPNGKVRPMPVKTGDKVLYRSRSAKAYFDPKFAKDYWLIMDDDILGVLA